MLLAAVLAVAMLGACARAEPEGRGAPPVTSKAGADDSKNNVVDLPEPPEAYGLPSLEQLRADPYATAAGLSTRSIDNAWTVTWNVAVGGEDAGTMTISHIPPEGGLSDRIHAQGEVSASDGKSIELVVLDNGKGARACVRQGAQPFVCDKHDFQLVLQFLSVQSLSSLTGMLREAMAKPGAAVVYKMIAGEPSTCFVFPPQPVSRETLGFDFDSGGVFCMSRIGAITKIETAQTSLTAIEYSSSADPATFTLPV